MYRFLPIACLALAPLVLRAQTTEPVLGGHVPDPAEALLRRAAQASPAMLEQEVFIAQSDAFRFRGWRQYMPYVKADYQGGYFNLLGSSDPSANSGQGRIGGTFNVSAYQPIWHWGAIEAEKTHAFARERHAVASSRVAWRALVGELRTLFLKAVVTKAKVGLAERRLVVAELRAAHADEAFAQGRIVAAERTTMHLALREQELAVTKTKVSLAGLVSQLRTQSGDDAVSVESLPATLPDLTWNIEALDAKLEEYERVGVDIAPETERAAQAAEVIRSQRIIAEARDLPTFNLGVNVSQTPIERNGGFGMQTYLFAGVMGSWNLFDRDANLENVRALRLAERLVMTRRDNGRRENLVALRGDLRRLEAAKSARDLRRELVTLREQSLELTAAKVAAGTLRPEDLALAEETLAQTQVELLEDRAEILAAYHDFMAGVLLAPADNYYTPPDNER